MRTFGLVSDVRLSGLATEGGGLLGAMGFFGVSFLLSLHLILVLGIGKGERTCTVDLVTQNKLWSICGRRLGGLEGKTEWFCGVRESDQWEISEGEKQTLMLLVVVDFAGPTQLLGRRDGWFVVGLGAGLGPCPAGRVGRWWGRM